MSAERIRRQRATLRDLDAARTALRSDPGSTELRQAHDRAVEAYWSCRFVRGSRRAGIKVREK
jgi:hypothetical protein